MSYKDALELGERLADDELDSLWQQRLFFLSFFLLLVLVLVPLLRHTLDLRSMLGAPRELASSFVVVVAGDKLCASCPGAVQAREYVLQLSVL